MLKEISIKTKKQRRLRDILILISRILFIISVVVAFAQPYIPVDKEKDYMKNNMVMIYIDNSFSMESATQDGVLLDQAKEIATEIIQAYHSTDKFYLLTNDFSRTSHRSLLLSEIQTEINKIEISPHFRSIEQVSQRVAQFYDENKSYNRYVYVLSDFQKTSFIEHWTTKLDAQTSFVPIQSVNKDNILIDTAWFETPISRLGENQKIDLIISNNTSEDYEKQSVILYVDSVQRAISMFDVAANDKVKVSIQFQPMHEGIHGVKLVIEDYPVNFDDEIYLRMKVKKDFQVISLYENQYSTYLSNLFSQDSLFQFTQIALGEFDYSNLSNCDLLILNEVNAPSSGMQSIIKKYVENGGVLCVIPGRKMDFDIYRTMLSSMQSNYYTAYDTSDIPLTYLNYQHPFFADVFESEPKDILLPKTKAHYRIIKNNRSTSQTLLGLSTQESFLETSRYKSGRIYLLAVSLNIFDSNYPKHAIFVPSFYKMLFYRENIRGDYQTLSVDKSFNISIDKQYQYEQYKVLHAETAKEFFPQVLRHELGINISVDENFSEAGIYYVLTEKDTQDIVALNYSRKESDLSTYTIQELDSIIETQKMDVNILTTKEKAFTEVIEDKNNGNSLWKIFIIFALFFAAIEVLLLRFWKI